jgi:hypothetical protein
MHRARLPTIRARRGEREGEPLGDPPEEWLAGAEVNARFRDWVEIWREIVVQAQFGVLSSMDRIHVESTVLLVYKIRRAAAGYGKVHKRRFCAAKQEPGPNGVYPE